ncbi:MAG: PEGA domain-containing protein [Myxococcales bacterium]|nr:PEGA domain-containing protein [Myxococcales bacterium]
MSDRHLGQYRLVRQLAVGGMAEIYVASAGGVEGFEKQVALKVIHPNFSADPEFMRMLVDEAKLAVQLQHANIVQTFDLGKVDDNYYIVMELIDGADLFKILKRTADQNIYLPLEAAVFIAHEVAAGLDYAHRKRDPEGRPLQIVHRDISPQNILVSHAGQVKIVDFGIAKAALRNQQTAAGVIKGKYYYMSPEQAWGDPIDGRTDIFSAGILLYEMLSGEMLYYEEDFDQLLDQVRKAEVEPPSTRRAEVPRALDAIVMRALERQADDRWQSAGELANALHEWLRANVPDFTPGRVGHFVHDLLGDHQPLVKTRQPTDPTAEVSIDDLVDEHSLIFQLPDLLQMKRRPAATPVTPPAAPRQPAASRRVTDETPGIDILSLSSLGGEFEQPEQTVVDRALGPEVFNTVSDDLPDDPTTSRVAPKVPRQVVPRGIGDEDEEEMTRESAPPAALAGRFQAHEASLPGVKLPGTRRTLPEPSENSATIPRLATPSAASPAPPRPTAAQPPPARRATPARPAPRQDPLPAESTATTEVPTVERRFGEPLLTPVVAVPRSRPAPAPVGPEHRAPVPVPARQAAATPQRQPAPALEARRAPAPEPRRAPAPAPITARTAPVDEEATGHYREPPRPPAGQKQPLPVVSAAEPTATGWPWVQPAAPTETGSYPTGTREFRIPARKIPRWYWLAFVLVFGAAITALVLQLVGPTASRGVIEVVSLPAGATVKLDAHEVSGPTPARIDDVELKVPHRITVTLAGYDDWEREVTFDWGRRDITLHAVLVPLTGAIHIASVPAGAEVIVNGRFRGQTPLEVSDLLPTENASVELRLRGFRVERRMLPWRGKRHLELNVPLEKVR